MQNESFPSTVALNPPERVTLHEQSSLKCVGNIFAEFENVSMRFENNIHSRDWRFIFNIPKAIVAAVLVKVSEQNRSKISIF